MVKDKTTDKADDPIEDAVQRSGLRPRPRLGTELEERLASTEVKAAAQYASMENMAARLHNLADEIELTDDDLVPIDEAEASAIPEPVDFEDSLVSNIEEVRAQLNKGLSDQSAAHTKPTE